MSITFSKLHGLGNHFILIDGVTQNLDLKKIKNNAKSICDPHRGIGADGIILVLSSGRADLKMFVINADGSEPQMCGNGLRCFGRFVLENQILSSPHFSVETGRGVLNVTVSDDLSTVAVEMGEPILSRKEIPLTGDSTEPVVLERITVEDSELFVTAVSMGNPHAIFFVEDLDTINLIEIGPKIETDPLFPEKTNVEFVHIENTAKATMKVWERGVGITQACGTGACAVLVAGVLTEKLDKKATISLPGGDLEIEWRDDGNIVMTGEAQFIYKGTL